MVGAPVLSPVSGNSQNGMMTTLRANSRLKHLFVWTRRTKLVCIKLGRFDMHPTPTLLIEGQTNQVDDRILSAYVNIEATLYVFQGARKV